MREAPLLISANTILTQGAGLLATQSNQAAAIA
jgi:hypothetical protein